MGTFINAIWILICHHLAISFQVINKLAEALKERLIVILFCTSGIFCEKATLAMLRRGFEKVY